MAARKTTARPPDANLDPISGETGAHPVGVGVGTAAGGAAAGVAAGLVAGPVGAVVGAVVGGLVGGLAGKGIAEAVEPTDDDEYWAASYLSSPYVARGAAYDLYRPAYRYGRAAAVRYEGKSFDAVVRSLARGWRTARSDSSLTWRQARPAVRDAWDRTVELRAAERRVGKRPAKKRAPPPAKAPAVEQAELKLVAARVTRTVKPRTRRR